MRASIGAIWWRLIAETRLDAERDITEIKGAPRGTTQSNHRAAMGIIYPRCPSKFLFLSWHARLSTVLYVANAGTFRSPVTPMNFVY